MSTTEESAEKLERPAAAIRFIGELRRGDVKPGDFFVINLGELVPADTVEHMRNELKAIVGDVPVIVMSKGMSLEAISRERVLAKLDKAQTKAKE